MGGTRAGDVADEFAAGWTAAWNQHDMQAFADLFHDDATFVNVIGVYMRGREEIRQAHAAVHAGPFRDSTLTAWLDDARTLGPDVIIAHLRSDLRGDDRMPGQVRSTLATLVIERRGAIWKILAAHNTNVLAAPT